MTIPSGTLKFLQELIPDYEQHAIFATEHKSIPGSWTEFRDAERLDEKRDCYLSTGILPDDGIEKREGRVQQVWALVIDDIGTTGPAEADVERALGPMTAEVLSSKGNAQWWYVLAERMPAYEWSAFFAEIERRVGKKLEGREAGHVFRLPMGLNTKTKRKGVPVPLSGQNFQACLGRHDFTRRLDAVGIMLFAEPVPSSEFSEEAVGSLPIDALREWMACIPNDETITREMWVNVVGHGLKGSCANLEEGFQVFDEWSREWKTFDRKTQKWIELGYDAAETRRAWTSFGASGGVTSKGGKLRALAELRSPARFVQWKAKIVFDDEENPSEGSPWPKSSGLITATPFKLRDASSLSLRDWLYGNILIRKFITMTVAPGGVGKSSLIVAETLAQITGCDLLWEKTKRPLRVWLWNLEDPFEETERKIVAAALRHGVTDIGDRLFVDSGRDQKLVIATTDRSKPIVQQPVVDALVAEIKRRGVDVLIIDPFVSCHEVPENDNMGQDMVVKEWGRVAELGNCAVHLLDHTRKGPQGTEVWTESARGAKAKTDAARVVRVINRMTDDEGIRHGVSSPRQYFYTLLDKANMSLPPPMEHRDWFHMESVNLGNGEMMEGMGAARMTGDDLGVVVRWIPPSAETLRTSENFERVAEVMGDRLWRTNSQANEWVGEAFGKALEFDPKTKKGRDKVQQLLKGWVKDKVLQTVMALDKHRIEKEFIQIRPKHEPFRG